MIFTLIWLFTEQSYEKETPAQLLTCISLVCSLFFYLSSQYLKFRLHVNIYIYTPNELTKKKTKSIHSQFYSSVHLSVQILGSPREYFPNSTTINFIQKNQQGNCKDKQITTAFSCHSHLSVIGRSKIRRQEESINY